MWHQVHNLPLGRTLLETYQGNQKCKSPSRAGGKTHSAIPVFRHAMPPTYVLQRDPPSCHWKLFLHILFTTGLEHVCSQTFDNHAVSQTLGQTTPTALSCSSELSIIVFQSTSLLCALALLWPDSEKHHIPLGTQSTFWVHLFIPQTFTESSYKLDLFQGLVLQR